jgi:hypothetical protein
MKRAKRDFFIVQTSEDGGAIGEPDDIDRTIPPFRQKVAACRDELC